MVIKMSRLSAARRNPGSSYYRPTPTLKCIDCNIIRPLEDFFSIKLKVCKECKPMDN